MNQLGRLELIRESLVAVVNEMRANIIHSSYSSIIYEGHDFSCGLVSADGRLIAQSLDDNPIHIFAVPYSTAEVVRTFGEDIHEGDIFLHNDPYTGGTHLNDMLILYPVFHAGRLALFAASRCHWGDVGGMTPGSLSGRVREIYQEGIRVVPTRICERGRMNDAFLNLLFANMRIEHERRGDFATMLGTSRKAAEHLQRLFARFGGSGLLDGIEELMTRAEMVMRARIAEVPDGVYYAEGYLDSNGHSPEPLIAKLRLTVDGDHMVADFTGSSPQTAGPTNVGPAMAFNAVNTMVKAFLDPHTSVNHGSFKPIEIINPPGSFLNAGPPAPCGGMVECRAVMAGLVASALGQALPHKRVGDFKGGANHTYMSGRTADGGMFLLYEYPMAGTGATDGADGSHGTRTYLEGDFNAVWAVELVEAQCPIQIDHYGLREGSFGDGQYRGGCGVRRDLRILSDTASLSVLSDKCVIPPYGVTLGKGGSANSFVVVREGEAVQPSPIPGKVGDFPLQRGDVVRIQTSGGGGFGDPLHRDPAKVLADIEQGYITADQARRRFGVVLSAEGQVDMGATQKERERLAAQRVQVAVASGAADEFDGTRRRVRMSRDVAKRLDVADGDLVELVATSCGGALRGWAKLDAQADGVTLGPTGLSVLGATPGARVELRAVPVEVVEGSRQ